MRLSCYWGHFTHEVRTLDAVEQVQDLMTQLESWNRPASVAATLQDMPRTEHLQIELKEAPARGDACGQIFMGTPQQIWDMLSANIRGI